MRVNYIVNYIPFGVQYLFMLYPSSAIMNSVVKRLMCRTYYGIDSHEVGMKMKKAINK